MFVCVFDYRGCPQIKPGYIGTKFSVGYGKVYESVELFVILLQIFCQCNFASSVAFL